MSRYLLSAVLLLLSVLTAHATDLPDIKTKGELRQLGVRYANFVTGAGDGFDVELMQGFAKHLGVKHTLVYADFYTVIRDLLGKDVQLKNGQVMLSGSYPVRGDLIATGLTVLPWREAVLSYGDPTFPSQVLLVARAQSQIRPIQETGDLGKDIIKTKALIGKNPLLVMERTCLDPALYGLKGIGLDLKTYTKSTNTNEMIPALLNNEAELTLLDVPDAILDLRKWNGQIKVLGPISEHQVLAPAFPKNAPLLKEAYNEYLKLIRENGTYDRLVDKYFPGVRRYFPEFFAKGK